jgi:hypothetical protein
MITYPLTMPRYIASRFIVSSLHFDDLVDPCARWMFDDSFFKDKG